MLLISTSKFAIRPLDSIHIRMWTRIWPVTSGLVHLHITGLVEIGIKGLVWSRELFIIVYMSNWEITTWAILVYMLQYDYWLFFFFLIIRCEYHFFYFAELRRTLRKLAAEWSFQDGCAKCTMMSTRGWERSSLTAQRLMKDGWTVGKMVHATSWHLIPSLMYVHCVFKKIKSCCGTLWFSSREVSGGDDGGVGRRGEGGGVVHHMCSFISSKPKGAKCTRRQTSLMIFFGLL